MRKTWSGLLLGFGVIGAVVPASAGSKGPWPITVNYTYRFAQGALGTARNSADTNQEIACNVQSSGWGYCYARDAAGNFGSCYANTDAQWTAIRSIGSDSGVYFDWNTSGYCGTIIVYQGSSYEPKLP